MIPLAVALAGRRVVVVGGGEVAAGKIAPLAAEGAVIAVIAPQVSEHVHAAATTVTPRRYAGRDDLVGARLVVAATGVRAVDDAIVADADALGILCVRSGTDADASVPGSATLMATVRRGPLVLAVSSGAPAVSRYVRSQIDGTFGPEYGDLALLVANLRRDAAVQASLGALTPSQRKARWRSLPFVHILGLLREGAFDAATELAFSCLSSSSD